jgi:hypothetical protein
VSVFASGSDDLVAQTAHRLRGLLDAGQAGTVRPGEPDPHAFSWYTDAVDVTLYASTGRPLGPHWVDATLHLALERTDTPSEGRTHDPARDRRVAHQGTPVARWYLAGHDELTDDVVDLLARDDDPAVAAALAAGEDNRRATREGQRAL